MQHEAKQSSISTTALVIALTIVVGSAGGIAAQGRGGAQRGGFPQFTRPLASQDVLFRGKELYEENCASCHAMDLRGGPKGPNLMRSETTLRDQHGERVGAAVARHTPALRLVDGDIAAIAEYIHSILATARR